MKHLVLMIAVLLSGLAFSQGGDKPEPDHNHDHHKWCSSHDIMIRQMESNIEFITNMNMLDEPTPMFDYRAKNITIPVVVHVVYNSDYEIPSEEDIQVQLDGLTKDFKMTNSDVDKTPDQFTDLVADLQISFKLATISPEGKRTNGITYTKTDKSYFTSYDDVKGEDTGGKLGWNSRRYLNIWVCDLEWGLLGYAQFPGGDYITDGVVVDYDVFGIDDYKLAEMEIEASDAVEGMTDEEGNAIEPEEITDKPYHRILTHEVGHWVGLRHIWGDDVCGNDKVDDTPYQSEPHWDCHDSYTSCGSSDMTTNYMDYLPEECLVMFSEGQKKRAWKAMKMFRKEMLRSRNKKLTQ